LPDVAAAFVETKERVHSTERKNQEDLGWNCDNDEASLPERHFLESAAAPDEKKRPAFTAA
jgi:hypothetical protein